MPTSDELDAMTFVMFPGSVKFGDLTPGDRGLVLGLAIDAKRNSILGDIVTTLDRIQNDTDSIVKVMWN